MAFESTFENNQLNVSVKNRFTIFEVRDFMSLVQPHAADLTGLSIECTEKIKVDTASIQLLAMLDKWLESKGSAIELTGQVGGINDVLSLFNLNLGNVHIETPDQPDE